MPKEAAGAYLRHLREARRLGRPSVANMILTSENQIKRIENGEVDSRGSLLLAFCHAVNGNAADLEHLMSNLQTTPVEGRKLAQEWLDAQTRPLSDEERLAMKSKLVDWLQDSPDLREMSQEDATRKKLVIAGLRRLLQRSLGTSE